MSNNGFTRMDINSPATVLAVDDDRTMLMMLVSKLEEQGHTVITARNGEEACQVITKEKNKIEAILLDREMPEMDGMKVIKWMKEDPEISKIPVIMQTGADQPDQIKAGIDAGVFYYLTKPIQDTVLRSVLTAAIREKRQKNILQKEMKRHGASFKLIDNCQCTLRMLAEAEDLACFLANCFPQPDRTLGGLAELLTNAVEHGNLGISYEEKTDLIANGRWISEINRRTALPQYIDRKISVVYKRTKEAFMIKITDDGEGFDWRRFIKVDPSRSTDNHGRGIAQANMISFDKINYNDKGNEVTAFVYIQGSENDLQW